ncbi:hypothetical protein F383_31833 [Gossypium arboreum]|uniref:Uncharacterized protein n=1 Tax=Gossypium arboreum TaxID=29729 RepID=A0A0B0N0H1_GOSAR|nr:hypothetical protein F383_31833 [Gossypium arboreum]
MHIHIFIYFSKFSLNRSKSIRILE